MTNTADTTATVNPAADAGTLYDYDTAEPVRAATPAELAESEAAARRDGGAGVIEVDGRSCYAQ